MSLAFNFCLCHDLIKTLKDPFYPGGRRLKWYIIFSLLSCVGLVILTRGKLEDQCEVAGSDWDDSQLYDIGQWSNFFLAMSLSVYIVLALYSCVYAYRRLTRPGMSGEMRSYFIKKHVAYVASFIVIWTFYLASAYYHLYTDQEA